MTKDDAEIELTEKQLDRTTVYCPLTKALCVENCECYFPGKIMSSHGGHIESQGLYIQHDDWYVSSPGCTCHSLVGES